MANPSRRAPAVDSSPAGQIIPINFRPKPKPGPDDDDTHKRPYHPGDPVPDGWYVFDPDPDRPDDPKFLLYDWPYEETWEGRLEALAKQVQALTHRLRAVERHGAGAR